MRLGRPKVALILTEDERVRLTSLAHRSRTAAQLARRARIVLACAEGHHNTVVAKRVRVSPATVGKWRARFLRDRIDGLLDEPRPGAPRTVTDAHVERVVMVTLEPTPPGATHWSTRSLATARVRTRPSSRPSRTGMTHEARGDLIRSRAAGTTQARSSS